MTRFFASDHHLGHYNIIQYSKRPFSSVREMDEKLLEYHNMVVKPNDHVTFLGDVTMRRGGRVDKEWFINEIRKYNGHKRLFLGNHDHFPIQTYIDAGFEKIYATWRDQTGLLFSHFPLHPSTLGSAIANVHGHIHTNQSPPAVMRIDKKSQEIVYVPYINISVEAINYRPISHEDLLAQVRLANS